jgi:hypothetical protein
MITLVVLMSMLAVWRATYMLQQETGPFAIFARLQAWFWQGDAKPGSLKDGLRCFYCTSIWVSIPFAAMCVYLDNFSPWWTLPLYVLGISTGAVLINLHHSKLEQ